MHSIKIAISCLILGILVSCSYLPWQLKQKDIDQYILAYNKLAEVSAQVEAEKQKSGAFSIFACEKCREIMGQAIKDAGYSDFKAFIIMDLRISYTMRYLIYLKITELVGEVSQDLPVEKTCSDPSLREHLTEEDKKTVDKYCGQAIAYTRYIEKIGGFFKNIAQTLMSKGDFDIIEKNFDKIFSAISNENLPRELIRSGGGDDWD